ncbi:S-layer glycoprotein N-glycosyltransferase AglJ [Halocatena pleomorpha]|uniref:S-layer glycoprotein N-glycosyltransferase AglJ n=1 Tax=Halocatena pleomorpha TaxID=1785090 RepID=A0A3P3R8Q6_9EURY|nr:S-layer glycoprotein N-glycosyltransferase AglJ [Halocatena pleomorpha]RRJ29851.1 S-layer glycoprotein N-glycosyltransferase AglJ [Halocatena pleomorpha]
MALDDVCVLIPTFNEAPTIGSVVDGFIDQGYTNVLVIDGGSTDDTQAVAAAHGARVIEQRRSGKGQAVREGLEYIDTEYIVLVDGDSTYDPADADQLLEPLFEGRADHVIGNRLVQLDDEAMSRLNRFGNQLINSAFTMIHGRDFGDILSGYRAFARDSLDQLQLSADGFTIETELAVASVKHQIPTAVVPIEYTPRPSESETNLDPIRDGGRIIHALYSMARRNNPLFYFGSVGGLSILFGISIGAFVGYDWFIHHVSHEALAVVSAFAILLGVQLFMFGVLSDMVIAVNREHTRQVQALATQLQEESSDTTEETSETPEGTQTIDAGN